MNKFSSNENEDYLKVAAQIAAAIPDHNDVAPPTPAMLFKAIADDNATKLENLLDRGVQMKVHNKSGFSPLQWAAAYGSVKSVTILLLKGADPTIPDAQGNTPLHFATNETFSNAESDDRYREVIELLLERAEVEADVPNEKGETPLWMAARRGRLTAVATLLEQRDLEMTGIAPNLPSPLICAAVEGYANIVQAMLDHKAFVQALRDHESRQTDLEQEHGWKVIDEVLWWAVRGGSEKVASLALQRGAHPSKRRPDARISTSPLFTPVSIAPLSNGFPPTSRLDYLTFTSPLYEAVARTTNPKVMEVLLTCDGVDVNSSQLFDQGLLTTAVVNENIAVVKFLLDYEGVNLNCVSKDGSTSLCKAMELGDEDMVELLLSRDGVDPNLRDDKLCTLPLHLAVKRGKKSILELLLRREDIDVNARDPANNTPLYCAIVRRDEETAGILLDHKGIDKYKPCGRGYPPPLQAFNANFASLNMLDFLLEKGIDINRVDMARHSVLHLACRFKEWRAAREFIERGADPNISVPALKERGSSESLPSETAAKNLTTPLLIFSIVNETETGSRLSEVIIKKGRNVNLNVTDYKGRTALMHAASDEGSEVLVDCLLERGADPTIKDANGHTARARLENKRNMNSMRRILLAAEQKWKISQLAAQEAEARDRGNTAAGEGAGRTELQLP